MQIVSRDKKRPESERDEQKKSEITKPIPPKPQPSGSVMFFCSCPKDTHKQKPDYNIYEICHKSMQRSERKKICYIDGDLGSDSACVTAKTICNRLKLPLSVL